MFITSRKKNKNKLSRYFDDLGNYSENHQKIPLLYSLTRRTILLLFLFLTTTIIFFLIGNFQEFLDENMTIIVKTISITACLLMTFSISFIIESFVFFIRKESKKSFIFQLNIALGLLSVLFSIAILIVFSFIDILSLGFPS